MHRVCHDPFALYHHEIDKVRDGTKWIQCSTLLDVDFPALAILAFVWIGRVSMVGSKMLGQDPSSARLVDACRARIPLIGGRSVGERATRSAMVWIPSSASSVCVCDPW